MYVGGMVGPPKTLQDLRKFEGAVRVSCRTCKRVSLHDREELIVTRSAGLQSCDWSVVRRDLRCSHCISDDVRVELEAFGEGLAALRQRRGQMITIELALTILHKASYSGSRPSVPIEAVRLALRALHPFVRDRDALERFWSAYEDASAHRWSGPAGCFRDLVRILLTHGYAARPSFAETSRGELASGGISP
jgi:hypothetical protein